MPDKLGKLSVLSVNVAGIGDTPPGISWETRADRIARWAQQHTPPDIVALQEVYGWLFTPPIRSCGRGFGVSAGDYDQIDILLAAFRNATGVTYRVAYLTGSELSFGVIPCQIYHAQSVLYNPGRLVNRSDDATGSFAHDADVRGPHRRRSLPLCNRGTRLMPLETLIDGPLQTDKCGRGTPSGPATVVIPENGHIAGSFVRLAFTSDPTKVINFFNIHFNAGKAERDLPVVRELIRHVGPIGHDASSLYYPPLLAGDLNELSLAQAFPDFKMAHKPEDPEEVVMIGIGATESVPAARYRARVTQTATIPDLPQGVSCPGKPETLISDHCGVFVGIARFPGETGVATAISAISGLLR
ncbi:endonuclease/exonuclease/phosphatase family protein [Streptomyces poonensis]|uniref:Endonuclease/exonuclease/phosphatase domain-containing protein n=1 Tax=Streptomyces poonensis TaxID=68255 RepID=A0A918UMF8_9ACTN|nr:endonuclease/exonuclease/phosphatase family protein [Streptomyces poonensis]GGZ20764.1 hypothetical protein GCM10010365_46360 [Streptomyces poonensis]